LACSRLDQVSSRFAQIPCSNSVTELLSLKAYKMLLSREINFRHNPNGQNDVGEKVSSSNDKIVFGVAFVIMHFFTNNLFFAMLVT
jgi:hypothetical protein